MPPDACFRRGKGRSSALLAPASKVAPKQPSFDKPSFEADAAAGGVVHLALSDNDLDDDLDDDIDDMYAFLNEDTFAMVPVAKVAAEEDTVDDTFIGRILAAAHEAMRGDDEKKDGEHDTVFSHWFATGVQNSGKTSEHPFC